MKEYIFDERDRPAVKEGLIELCASIARDAYALRDLVEVAEKRTHGAR
jgi:hypothetical protein